MSIVLPPDIESPVKPRRNRGKTPLLVRLKDLHLWQMIFGEQNPTQQEQYKHPTGKIRLVTSRWDDRRSRTHVKPVKPH